MGNASDCDQLVQWLVAVILPRSIAAGPPDGHSFTQIKEWKLG